MSDTLATVLLSAGILATMAMQGFFAGFESGLLNVSRARLLSLERSGAPRAKILSRIASELPLMITTILVGTNIAAVLLSTFASMLAVRLLPSSVAAHAVWSAAFAAAGLFCCEYFPKLLFTTRPLRRTLLAARAFELSAKALYPVVMLFSAVVKLVFPAASAPRRRLQMSREGLRTLVSDCKNGARITPLERSLIGNVLSLQARTVRELMIPAAKAVHVEAGHSMALCAEISRRTMHGHLPVFSPGGEAAGVLDMLKILRRNRGVVPEGCAGDFARPPFSVDADTPADNILPLMRRRHEPMLFVEERSSKKILGILTEENILAVLTGSEK